MFLWFQLAALRKKRKNKSQSKKEGKEYSVHSNNHFGCINIDHISHWVGRFTTRDRPIRLTQCCTQFKPFGKFFCEFDCYRLPISIDSNRRLISIDIECIDWFPISIDYTWKYPRFSKYKSSWNTARTQLGPWKSQTSYIQDLSFITRVQ